MEAITETNVSLPHSLFAETAVLGSILLEPESLYAISQIITEEDFYKDSHKRIYRALFRLHEEGQAIDMVTLRQRLLDEGILDEVGGVTGLMELFEAVPSAANHVYYANIMRDKAAKRDLIRLTERVAKDARDEEIEAEVLLEDAETGIFNLSQKTQPKGLTHVAGLVADAYENIGREEKGIPTFTDLDTLLGGLKKTDLVIVAARPAMGKTSFCINIAERAATKHGCSVAVFSLEMSNIQLSARMLFSKADVDQSRAKRGKITEAEWAKIRDAMNGIMDAELYLDDTPGITVAEIRGKCRRLQRERGLDLIVVDYIQLMQSSTSSRQENRQQQISEISRQLKGLAKELDVPVVAISQLSRAAVAGRNEREPKKPDLSHLRESGALEQDADVVLFIHRPSYYDPENSNKLLALAIVAKHRNGPVGEVKLGFKDSSTLFFDMDFDHDETLMAPPPDEDIS